MSAKMVSTPQRSQLNTSIFSPVRVCDTPPSAKADTLGLRQRIKTIVRHVLDNHTKWLAVQRRGTTLCSQIEAIKQRALDECRADAERASAYPPDLRVPCAKFKVIITILDDMLAAAADAERQLQACERLLQADVAAPVFRTWPLSRFVRCVATLRQAYASELPVRRQCIQEIAHAQSKEELVLHCCVWDHPCHVNARLDVEVLSLRQECDIEDGPAVAVVPAGQSSTKKTDHATGKGR